MNIKEYLKQYERAGNRVRRLETRYKELNEIAGCVRSPMDQDGQPRARNITKPTEEKAVMMADVFREMEIARAEALQLQVEIYTILVRVPDVYGDLLIERYIHCKPWEDVADHIGYSLRWTYELHRRALEMLKKDPEVNNKALQCSF